MVPLKQVVQTDDKGNVGDCFRTCLASVLDYQDPRAVPHFFESADMNAPVSPVQRARWNIWLQKNHGLVLWEFAIPATSVDEVLGYTRDQQPDTYFLLSGLTGRGHGHVVVARGGEIVHDPHPFGSGLSGPMPDGFFWVSLLGKYMT